MELTVITFNIHKGKHPLLSRETLDPIRDFLVTHSVDVVFLQEAIGADPKRDLFDQVAYLAEGLSSQFCYGKNFIAEQYHHGNAILSRYPIVRHHNTDLSSNRYERRGLLEADIDLPHGKKLKAFCCHLNLLRESRRKQIAKVAETIEKGIEGHPGPVFAGGDFNDWQRDANSIFFEHGWKEVGMEGDRQHFLTYPSYWPRMALDRIYYRAAALVEAQTLPYGDFGFLSDHLPILAKFRIP